MTKLSAVTVLIVAAVAFGMTFPDLPYSHTAACGDYLLAFTKGLNNRFLMMNRDGDVVVDSAEAGLVYEAFIDGVVTPDGRRLALLVDDVVVSFIVILEPDGTRCEFKYDDDCGPPVWDKDGDLWYAAAGMLYRNGGATGTAIDAPYGDISLSPDGRFIAYDDEGGALCRLELATGAKEVIAADRAFVAPFYTPTGLIVSGCSEGEIWLFDAAGEGKMISEGIEPAWCEETSSVLFAKPSADAEGEYIPASEIWIYELAGNLFALTNTPDVAEVAPQSWRGDLVAVDNDSGKLVFVKQEW